MKAKLNTLLVAQRSFCLCKGMWTVSHVSHIVVNITFFSFEIYIYYCKRLILIIPRTNLWIMFCWANKPLHHYSHELLALCVAVHKVVHRWHLSMAL